METVVSCFLVVIFLTHVLAKPFDEITRRHAHEPPLIDVPLATFDGAESSTFKFHELNDPVMVSHKQSITFCR